MTAAATKPRTTRKAPSKAQRAKIAVRTTETPPGPILPVVWEIAGGAAREFCGRIRAVAGAASTDDARRVLTGVHFTSDGTSLRLDATDSYRLYRLDDPNARLPRVTALVPAAFLIRHLPKRPSAFETLRLHFTDKRFTIEFADETYSCNLIGGDFPNTGAIIDQDAWKDEGHEFVKAYNPKYLVDIYKAAAALGSDYYSVPVRVMAGLDAMKPTKFVVATDGITLTMMLMPVRIP